MAGLGWSIYTAAEPDVTTDLLDTFLAEQRRDRQFMESMTLELKRERRGNGVPDAVCAFANSGGGLVIVGVDEKEPTLSGTHGLSPDSVVSLSDQLRGALGSLVNPEIIPIPVGAEGKVVLLIRIEADPSLWPVVSNGRVMVRNPGQSVAATREQILDLVRRHGSAGYDGQTSRSLSIYAPSAVMPDEAQTRGDLLFRLATAVHLRPRAGVPFQLGSDERAELRDAFATSPFGRLFDESRPTGSTSPRARDDLVDEVYSSTHFVMAATIGNDEHLNRLTLRVDRDANQVAVVIEAEARRPRPESVLAERGAPSVSRPELIYIAICGLETLSKTMVPALVRLAGGAPIRIDDIYLWAQAPATQDLSKILSVTGGRKLVPSTRASWGATVRQVDNKDDAVEVLRPQLETLYIDLGFTDERDLASVDLAEGLRRREWQD